VRLRSEFIFRSQRYLINYEPSPLARKLWPEANGKNPMTEADANLSPNLVSQRMLRHRSAVMTLARMRAKKLVLLALRAQGLKSQHFSAREIAVLTDYYLNQHRAKLMAEAAEAIATWPEFARWRCAELSSDAQTTSEPKSVASVVQNSSAEWRADQ
jgi:hypothetical protein